MNKIKVATWNVNSIRTRVEKVIEWITENNIHVLLMQETKCKNDQFPEQLFTNAGYEVVNNGDNQWNGVAIASKIGLNNIKTEFKNQPGFSKDSSDINPPIEARYISANCNGIEVASIYVPNGRGLDDPHYFYKLKWLESLAADIKYRNEKNNDRLAIYGGDWNIAPLDNDVWDPNFFIGKTHTSKPERDAFKNILNSGLVDTTRESPTNKFPYTYWDYTSLRFQKNEGMRIDFILNNENLTGKITDSYIDKKPRYGKGTSDHTPVVLEISL